MAPQTKKNMKFSLKAKGVLAKFAQAGGISEVDKKIKALTKKVGVLAKVSYDKVDTWSSYAANFNMTGPYNAFNLSRIYTACNPVWGYTVADLANSDKAYLNSKDIKIHVRQRSEPNLIRYTMFVVSLKDQGATATLFDPATRSLNLVGSGQDYVTIASDMVMLNPEAFTVHHVKRFTMGYEGTQGPTSDTYSEKRFAFTIKPKQKLIHNPTGNLFNNSQFSSPVDPSQNYFVILFNDNSGTDLEFNQLDVQVIDHWAIPS